MNTIEHTGSQTTMDEQKFLKVFPAEIWKMITSLVKDNDSLEILSSSFPFFRGILQPQTFLFPKVYSILRRHLGNSWLGGSGDPRVGAKRRVHLFATLKLRLVCSFWNQGIEQHSQNAWQHTMAHCLTELPNSVTMAQFKDSEEINRFMNHFKDTHENTHKNPILHRILNLHINLADYNVLRDGLRSLLSAYGQHIWWLYIMVGSPVQVDSHDYLKLLAVFNSLPNLKKVEFLSTSFPTPEYVAELEKTVVQYPLNPLTNLEMIYTTNFPSPIISAISNASTNLRTIYQNGEIFYGSQRTFQDLSASVYLQNINNIVLKNVPEYSFHRFSGCQANNLKKLTLEFLASKRIDWVEIIEAVNRNWGNSLEHLDISFGRIRPSETFPTLELKFLKSLYISMDKCAQLDFILPCKNALELLSVRINSKLIFGVNERLAIRKGSSKHLRFNCASEATDEFTIWEIFPKLKLVQCEHLSNKKVKWAYDKAGVVKPSTRWTYEY